MSKAGRKIIEGLSEAVAYSRIDALWRRTKKPKGCEDISMYDWGYRDGIMAARALFGKTHVVRVPKKSKASRPRPNPKD